MRNPDLHDSPSTGGRGLNPIIPMAAGLLTAACTALVGIVGIALSDGERQSSLKPEPLPAWVWPLALALLSLAVSTVALTVYFSLKDRRTERDRQREEMESAADRLREKMELPSIVEFNRVLLNQYHEITTRQANKAFKSSLSAMGFGLAILAICCIASFQYNSQGDRIFIGSLALVGAAFTGFLSKTYMVVYQRSLQQLNQYFDQPVLNGYFLTAERIVQTLPEARQAEMLEHIVDDILESGKEMHRNTVMQGVPKQPQPKRPRREKRGREIQADRQAPQQGTP